MANDVKYEVNAGFFDAIDKDRLYSADDMNRPYRKLISNGIFATPKGTPSDNLQVFSANDDMNIVVFKGDAIIGDKWFENPSNLIITIPQNLKILTRIDSIVAQMDKTQVGRVGNIVYRQGSASSNPVHPDINTEENIIEFRLADIKVSPSCVKITQDLITDCRGSDECPWITSLIYQVDTSTLYEQWQAAYQKYYEDQEATHNGYFEEFKNAMASFFAQEEEDFTAWFKSMKDQLSEDAAGNLQKQLDELIGNLNKETKIAVGIDEPKKGEDIWLQTKSKNLFNETQIVKNKGMTIVGEIVDDTAFNISDYIPVKAGESLVVDFKTSGMLPGVNASYESYCFYNTEKVFINGNNYDQSGLTVKVNENGYFRIAYNKYLDVEIYSSTGAKLLLKDGDTYNLLVNFNELNSRLNEKNSIIYDLTLENNATHISIPCDILKDGGYYELTFIGRYDSGVGDISLNLNNNKSNIYFQSGFAYNFSANSDNPEVWSGYRAAKDAFYICSSIISEKIARCMIKYKIALSKANDIVCMGSQLMRTYNGNCSNAQASCQTSEPFNNITTIDLYAFNNGSIACSFAAGSRFTLKKI